MLNKIIIYLKIMTIGRELDILQDADSYKMLCNAKINANIIYLI